MLQYIDTHCHFDFLEFDHDRDQLWQSCQNNGIGALIIPGIVPKQWANVVNLCKTNDKWYYGAGIHPWWLSSGDKLDRLDSQFNSESLEACISNAFKDHKCIAIGECGLDKINGADWSEQLRVFEWHLSLAVRFRKPLIIHCVKAHNDMIQCLKRYRHEAGGVIHAFSGSFEIAKSYWELGFFLGVGGVITYDRAKKTRDAVRRMPLESLLLETDAPDMPLNGKQGQHNSPVELINIAEYLAQIRQESLQTIAAGTTANATSLFKID